ncbi:MULTISPECIES: PhzF family phenazine biosynthesis protein [unclassified Ruegeria]|uniref:PhzF family phenazine biosynthesis protein n=1 Tax=unclassified Ruegeria TaxID=2625375 RepID=UPI001492BB05|nr:MULTISPECIES: PhzF family phenazine biosynthesis protein [unclassified Ruegeria]NOD36907.1 PhzF family phenazine biosynthesis isomerase [Ruegeria sp. HKCCD7296]NOE44067.1 PhzF family phenazine biosynthesis isomerase [Ruegeria sp. HKCCD7319]
MNWFEFDWVDAFSDRAFGGNGCAVVHGGAHLSENVCMDYVRETSLVECTFTGPSDVADIRVRYFLASREIPFAGHPTIATVAAMRSRGMIEGDSLTLETGAGIVSIRLQGAQIEMTQVAPQFGPRVPADLVASAVNLPSDAIISPPQLVSTGLPFCITVLRDHKALRAAQLVEGPLRKVAEAAGFSGSDMAEPFLVTLYGATDAGDTFSRLLLAPPSPPEDPFTGSATGAMAAYLWKYGLMAKDSFIAEQGHDMGRPGQARVTRVGPADAMTGIRVAGQGHILMRGQVDLPADAQ